MGAIGKVGRWRTAKPSVFFPRGNEPALAREVKNAARVDDRLHFAQRLERVGLAVGANFILVEIDLDLVARLDHLAERDGAFIRIKLAGRDRVAEKDAGEA